MGICLCHHEFETRSFAALRRHESWSNRLEASLSRADDQALRRVQALEAKLLVGGDLAGSRARGDRTSFLADRGKDFALRRPFDGATNAENFRLDDLAAFVAELEIGDVCQVTRHFLRSAASIRMTCSLQRS